MITTTITTYPVTLHTANSKPISADHRLAVLNWKEPTAKAKTSNANLKKLPALCVSLPAIKLTVSPTELASVMQSAFYDMQDACIRADIERQIGDYIGQQLPVIAISETTFNLDAVIAAQSPGKLSKDMIGQWFDTSLSDNLAYAVLAKRGFDIKSDPAIAANVPAVVQTAVDNAVVQVREMLLKMAAPTWNFAPHIIEQLQRCVIVADESTVKTTLLDKLTRKLQPAEIATLDAL